MTLESWAMCLIDGANNNSQEDKDSAGQTKSDDLKIDWATSNGSP